MKLTSFLIYFFLYCRWKGELLTFIVHKSSQRERYYVSRTQKYDQSLADLLRFHLENGIQHRMQGGEDTTVRLQTPLSWTWDSHPAVQIFWKRCKTNIETTQIWILTYKFYSLVYLFYFRYITIFMCHFAELALQLNLPFPFAISGSLYVCKVINI